MKKLIIALAATFVASMAHAVPMTIGFDDGTNPQNGIVSWAGGATPLIGVDIDLYSIDGTNTPANSGPGAALDCRGCLLNFATGNYIGAAGGVLSFATGGSFVITGDAFTQGGAAVASGTLLSGVFGGISPTVTLIGSTALNVGFGFDTKHPDLVDYFGFPVGQEFTYANTNISLASCGPAIGLNCAVTNADVDNVARVSTPGTVALAGLGLVALGMRRKRQQV